MLRSLLRTVNAQLTSVSGNRLWHDEVPCSYALITGYHGRKSGRRLLRVRLL